MNTKKISTFIAAFLALAMLASACGGGDASAGDQEVIDAVAQASRDEGDVPSGVDVDCMAGAMVKGLGGAENMESQYGLTVATIADGQDVDDVELPKDDAISMADGMMDCGLIDVMVSEMGSDMSEDDARCLVDKMDQDALRDTFAAEFMSPADADAVSEAAESAMFSSMFSAIGDCNIDPASLGL